MSDQGPKRFDQIVKDAGEGSSAFFSSLIILAVGTGRALYTLPIDEPDSYVSWGWKVALFFGLMIPITRWFWKTARFDTKAYRETGAFMAEALKGPAVRELPFKALARMRELAWAEHQSQRTAPRPRAPSGVFGVQLVDASGEEILVNTRIRCSGCSKALSDALPGMLWNEYERPGSKARVPEDLTPAWTCAACGSAVGRFRTSLQGPVDEPA